MVSGLEDQQGLCDDNGKLAVTSTGAQSAPALSVPRVASVGVLGVVCGTLAVFGYQALVGDHNQDPAEAVAQVLVASTFVVSGLIAASRRPASRVGLLLVAAGIGLLLRRLQYSNDALLFTIGFALGEISSAFIAHAVLGYPSGRVRARSERWFVGAGYVIGLLLPVLALAFFDAEGSCFYNCDGATHAHSLIGVFPSDDAASGLRTAFRVVAFGILGGVFIVLAVRKFLAAGAAGRRLFAPLLIAGLAAASRAVSEAIIGVSDHSEFTRKALFWWQMAVLAAIPISLLIGLLRSRLARAAVADMLPVLEKTPSTDLSRTLGNALGDPTLQVAFWYPQEGTWVDAEGAVVSLPTADSGRSVTHVEHGGPVAALIHDPMLVHEPHLVEDVAAAAGLTLENARLQAELQAQLVDLRESRARLVTAADIERRRIERNLHDGAQQRLLAVALELTKAERRVGELNQEELRALLDGAVSELREAVADLRHLAHGLHPTILAEQGLRPAVSRLGDRMPVPTRTIVQLQGRLPPRVEATVYYVVSEALANVEKHARASEVTVRVIQNDGRVVAEVIDDGVGGVDPLGSGLRGLRDRVEANGGHLEISSRRDKGTRLVAELPCAS
jgi:signal transduction histidine kinase